MKVAFWSNGDHNNGVTSNLACISIASTFEYSHKAILIESHQQKNKLENLIKYNVNCGLREVQNQLRRLGMSHILNYYMLKNDKKDALFEKQAYTSKSIKKNYDTNYLSSPYYYNESNNNSKLIKDSSLEVIFDKLYYLPTDYLSNHHMYEYNLYQNIQELLCHLDDFADVTFIDTSNQKLSSKIIMEEADIIVVNFVQKMHMLDDFFLNYSSILNKCIFLISNYKSKSSLNINHISKTYLIPKNRIVGIPHNDNYQMALSEGTLIEFITRNYKCGRNNPNFYFSNQIKQAVRMLQYHINEKEILKKEMLNKERIKNIVSDKARIDPVTVDNEISSLY